jgi:hypothetical protein
MTGGDFRQDPVSYLHSLEGSRINQALLPPKHFFA